MILDEARGGKVVKEGWKQSGAHTAEVSYVSFDAARREAAAILKAAAVKNRNRPQCVSPLTRREF